MSVATKIKLIVCIIICIPICMVFIVLPEHPPNCTIIRCNYSYPFNQSSGLDDIIPPSTSTNQPDQVCDDRNYSFLDQKDIVHIAVCIDEKVTIGFMALVHSMIQNVKNRTVLHVITTQKNLTEKKIGCISIPSNLQIVVLEYQLPNSTKQLIHIEKEGKLYLKSDANFLRLYLDKILAPLKYVIFMDVDMVVKQDLRELWNEVFGMEEMLAAVPEKYLKQKEVFKKPVREQYKIRYNNAMDGSKYGYNAGMLGLNLRKLKVKNFTEEAVYWMNQNKKHSLWGLGTQPIMIILGHKDCKYLKPKWNVSIIKKRNSVKIPFKKVAIHHWNGPCKPWMNCTQLSKSWKRIWKDYDKGLCSNHGICNIEGVCNCTSGYHGDYCNNYNKTINISLN